MPLPLIPIAIGAVALLGGYEYLQSQKKKDAAQPAPAPPPIQSGPAIPGVSNASYVQPLPAPAAPAAMPVAPSIPIAPAPVNPAALPASNPQSAAANSIANITQPQPPNQPPLPPAPPAASVPPGQFVIVSTKDTGNAGALRVRNAPSTTAPVVAGGEPGSGGGYPHLSTIQVTGPMTAGFWPTTGHNAAGQIVSGWAWAGYTTASPSATQISGEEYADMGFARKHSKHQVKG